MVTFRPSYRSRFSKTVQLSVLLGLLTLSGFTLFQKQIPVPVFLICGFWLIFFSGYIALSLHRLQGIKVSMNDQNFQTQVGNESIEIAWQDILFVRLVENFLELATNSRRYVISLEHLDTPNIWEHVQRFAPKSAFSKGAYLRVPEYQKAIEEYKTLLQDQTFFYRVGYSRATKIGRWLLFLGFLMLCALLLLLFFQESSVPKLFLIGGIAPFLSLTGILALQSIQTLEVSSKKVVVNNGFRKRCLHWDEIEKLEADMLYKRFIFYGKNKRLVAPGLTVWGQNNEKLDKMIRAKAWTHSIELKDRNRRQPTFLLTTIPTS